MAVPCKLSVRYPNQQRAGTDCGATPSSSLCYAAAAVIARPNIETKKELSAITVVIGAADEAHLRSRTCAFGKTVAYSRGKQLDKVKNYLSELKETFIAA
jgi:hypothetical protein